MTHMLGALVNAGAVFVGGLLGALLGRLLNKKIGDAVMAGLALAVIYIGYSGSLAGSHTLVAILSLVIGAVIGTLLRLEDRVRSLGARLEKLVSKGDSGDFAKGFVSASLLFCVGAMAITGPLDSGLRNNHTTQYVKGDGLCSRRVFADPLVPNPVFAVTQKTKMLFSAKFLKKTLAFCAYLCYNSRR